MKIESKIEEKVETKSKSQRIRELSLEGKTISQIAKSVGIRYQFAYNVLHRPLKRK